MFVYFVRAGNRGAIKIGVASNVERRLETLQTGNAFKLHVLATIPCDNRGHALTLEARFHKFFARQRIRGEWFQGNIDFRKINGIIDCDNTKSALDRSEPTYKHVKNAKKKRKLKAEKLAKKITK